MKLTKDSIIQFIKYFFAAGAAVIVNVISRVILTDLCKVPFSVSVIIAYFIGHIVNYTISVFFVFTKDGRQASVKTFAKFTLVAMGGLLVTFTVSILLRNLFFAILPNFNKSLLETAAHILSTGCSFLCNYIGHLLFSFRKSKKQPELQTQTAEK